MVLAFLLEATSCLRLQMVLPLLGSDLHDCFDSTPAMAENLLRTPLQSVPRPYIILLIPGPRAGPLDARRSSVCGDRLVQRRPRGAYTRMGQQVSHVQSGTVGSGIRLSRAPYHSAPLYSVAGYHSYEGYR